MRAKPTLTIKEWGELRSYVLARDNYTCEYCGIKDVKICIDHKRPLAQGGTDNIDNLATACSRCNSQKANRTVEQWRRGDKVINSGYEYYERFIVAPKVRISRKLAKKMVAQVLARGFTLGKFCWEMGQTRHSFSLWKKSGDKGSILCTQKTYIRFNKAYTKLMGNANGRIIMIDRED